ncbi:MAG: ABC transporter permease [Pikeienuella sp.]
MLLKLILMRVFAALWVLLAVSVFLFVAVETLPGDFASASAPRFVTADQIEAARERMGLNVAPVVRYIDWITRAVEGDFGTSWYSRQPIADILAERLGHTALLAAFAGAIAVPFGFGLGVFSVIYRGSFADRAITSGSLVAISLPEFLVAYLLMAIFTIQFQVFDAFTVFTDDMSMANRLAAMALPAMALSIVAIAPVLRLTRASLINILASPYVEMARLKGVSVLRIVLWHMLPNAIAPIVNAVVIVIANLLAGAFVVEAIFSYPGIGVSMVSAVKFRDIPLVLSTGLIFALFFVTLNLIADVIAILADPKLRDGQDGSMPKRA